MTSFTLKRRLQAGERLGGVFVFSPDPTVSEIAGRAGFDFAVIDREHTALAWSDVAAHVRAAAAVGMPVLVRVAALRPDEVSRALDLGAEGVLLPHFGLDPAASTAAVRAARFAPDGDRGTCTGTRAAGFGSTDFAAYARDANANALVVAQIEDHTVVPHLRDLLARSNVDVVMPGLADLGTSLGVPGQFGAPEVLETVDRIFAAAEHRALHVCAYVANAEQEEKWCSAPVSMLIHSIDYKLLCEAFQRANQSFKKLRPNPGS